MLGFARAARKSGVTQAAGLTTLAGDEFGDAPTIPMVPGTWGRGPRQACRAPGCRRRLLMRSRTAKPQISGQQHQPSIRFTYPRGAARYSGCINCRDRLWQSVISHPWRCRGGQVQDRRRRRPRWQR
ncbi:hypothetical protein [Mycobacterium szulgai]|uniref:PPW family C-terminal domain-containing PPE protein n=1 Tax=Mycobacterium szulgai TaxID=1787 RepID=UPI003557349A